MEKKNVIILVVGVIIGAVIFGGLSVSHYEKRISELNTAYQRLADNNQRLRIENRRAREIVAGSADRIGAVGEVLNASEIAAFTTANRISGGIGIAGEIRADIGQLGRELSAIEGILGRIAERSAASE